MNEEAQKLLKQAKVLDAFGRGSKAIPLMERALALTPNDSNLLCHLAVEYHRANQWDKMRECAEKAIGASPNAEWPHRLYSISLRHLHKLEESLSAAREAVHCAPAEPKALNCLGMALLKRRLTAEAEETAQRLVQVAPTESYAHLLLAHVYKQQMRWAEMEQCARRALAQEAENGEAHLLLAQSLTCQKRKKEAFACYVDLLRVDPTHAVARDYVKNTFVNPLLTALALLTPLFWFCFYKLGGPVLQPIIPHGFIVGLAAFCAACCLSSALNAILFRFFPGLFLMPQKNFREQPLCVQEYVRQECRRDWLHNTWTLHALMFVSLPFLVLVAAPFYFKHRRARLAHRSVRQTKAGQSSSMN